MPKQRPPCVIEDCGKPNYGRGYCQLHYTRWRTHGDPHKVSKTMGRRAPRRPRPACTIDGCERPNFGRGYCQMHYTRWRSHGDPHSVVRHVGDPMANFRAKVMVGGADECWPWIGALDGANYGCFRVNGRSVGAHRWFYEQAVGPVPVGLELDHLCHTGDRGCLGGPLCLHRRCVNPAHLEPVPPAENVRRGRSPHAINAAKTACVNGHAFDTANTYVGARGGRSCRKCATTAATRYRLRQKL